METVHFEPGQIRQRMQSISNEVAAWPSRWIPVEEQMPPPYTVVLGGAVMVGEWVEVLVAWHKTHWYTTPVTHWMPLPEPPANWRELR